MPRPLTRNAAGRRRRKLFPLLVGLALTALCLPGPQQSPARAATTFTVNTTGDGADSNLADNVCNDGGGNCSLRAAIQQANFTSGTDAINVEVAGTINLTGALPAVSTNMTISGPGPGSLTVRRDTGGVYRVFTVSPGVTATISGLTVTNGLTADGAPSSTFASPGAGGGGISNAGTLTLSGCVITGNATGNGGAGGGGIANGYGGPGGPGGGVYNTGTLKMTGCSVTSNRTGDGGTGTYSDGGGGSGGGIANSHGTLTLINCLVGDNLTGTGSAGGARGSGGSGGGIFNDTGTLNVTNSVVGNNVTGSGFGGGGGGGFGGGIYSGGSSSTGASAVLTHVTVRDNRTGDGSASSGQAGFGGGIFNGGTMRANGLTVSGNVAGKSGSIGGGVGGGIDNSGGVMDLVNATISGNSTSGPGGTGAGLWNAGTTYLTNCTVAFNSAFVGFADGVHVFNDFYRVIIRNTIVARNGKPNTFGSDVSGPNITSQGYNLIGNAEGSSSFNAAGDKVGTSAAPLDPKLGPLADNGGPTLTHALLGGSPALDAGNNTLAKDANNNAVATDQRGVGRFGGAGGVADIGAYEYHGSLEEIADKTTFEDTPLSFFIDIGDGSADFTSVTAASDNQALAPDAGLTVIGSGPVPVRTLQITPAADGSGSAQVTVSVTHSGGSVETDTFQLTVTPVNDAPSFTKGADQTVAEDAGPQTVSGWATGVSAGPNESSQAVSFQVTGNTNAALFSAAPAVSSDGTLTYTTAPNASGSATVTLVAKDDGGTANGGQDTSPAQTFTITVTPVNDPPAAQNQSVTTQEDVSRFISLGASDPESNSLTVSIVSGPSHGSLSGTGLSRTYLPAANYVGDDSFTFKVTDSGGAESGVATVSITVTAVNDPPVNTAPFTQTTGQNATLVFSAANSNAISVADVDAGTDPLRVTFSVTNGTLTLGGTAGLTFTAGDGADDATMTFAGTLTDLNAALSGLAFKPTAGFSGVAILQITTNDQGSTGAGGARSDSDPVTIIVSPGTVELKQSSYTAVESSGSLAVVVRRTGDTAQAVSVTYATDDGSIPSVSVPCSATTGAALDRCDFTEALGRLTFAPGETEKTISVLLGDDSYVEGTETALIRLTGLTGTGVVLGTRTVATLEITDDPQESSANPIDGTARFVRQHYHDFLNREPDAEGLAFWTQEIEQCGTDQQCREVKRINVSAAFFLSIEFQQTGYLVYRLDKVAFGNLSAVRPVPLTLTEFLSDTQQIGQGVVVGGAGWEDKLEANKRAFIDAFVLRSRFVGRYAPSTTTPEFYVDSLNANAGGVLTQEERDALVADLKGGLRTRAQVLRAVAEHATVTRRESNRAFVLMQYFGYLRRNPDDAPEPGLNFNGYSFWLGKLNEFNGNYVAAEMVKAFLDSIEYRQRFGR